MCVRCFGRNLHRRSAVEASLPSGDAPPPSCCGGQWLLIGVRDVFTNACCCCQCLIDRQLYVNRYQISVSTTRDRIHALNTPSARESQQGGVGASLDGESSSATDPAATGVTGCQSATQQDAWCDVDCLGDN